MIWWILAYIILSYPATVGIMKFGNWYCDSHVNQGEISYIFWASPISAPVLGVTLSVIIICDGIEKTNKAVTKFVNNK